MVSALGEILSRFFRRTAPDPFVLAVLLTAAVFVAALIWTEAGPTDLVGYWSSPSGGVWRFLGFAMQMCLILVTGYALADSPPVRAALERIASIPKTARQGAAMVSVVACVLALLNWGLGLIGGALLARAVGRSLDKRGIPAHYPVLVAAGYMGLMVWHGGLSGTAPTKVTTVAELNDVLPDGIAIAPITLDETLFSFSNLIVTGGLVVLAAVLLAMLMPKAERSEGCGVFVKDEPEPAAADSEDARSVLIRMLEESRFVNLLLAGLIGFWAWTYYLPAEGRSGIFTLTPNTINLTMLMLGLLLHRSPRTFVASVENAARGCAGIMIQFPLYAGIMGMMFASGLTAKLAEGVASVSTAETLPVMTCFSAAIVNLFVPSGGGQWGVQGPIAIQTALDAGVELPKMVMAVAYGDQLTNMLQPFWALPLLAITGAKARDIVGYTAVVMVAGLVWTGLCLLIL